MTLAYEECGTGPALVLLHAFPFDRGMWAPQRDGLSDVARVITPDLPGFGESPVVSGITIAGMADAVVELVDAVCPAEGFVLGGLSMGGYVAMAVTRKSPRRLRGLILADTRAEPDDDAAKANRETAIALANSAGPAAFAEAQLPKQLCRATWHAKPSVVALARRIGSAQTVEGVVAGLAALRDRPDAVAGLSGVNVPMLILVGTEDAITPPTMAETMRTRVPGSRLVRIPGAGHLSNLEQPDVFNAAVRGFLRG